MGISTYAFARNEQTVNAKNEYKGQTVMITFAPADKEYKEGIAKAIAYYDSKGKMTRTEIFYNDDFAKAEGVVKTIVYYDGNGKRLKMEGYHTDEFIKKEGIAKGIFYYDNSGKKVKTETYDKKGKLLNTAK